MACFLIAILAGFVTYTGGFFRRASIAVAGLGLALGVSVYKHSGDCFVVACLVCGLSFWAGRFDRER